MRHIHLILFAFLVGGCVTSPKEAATQIQSVDRSQVLRRESAATSEPAMIVKFNERTKGELEEKDPIFYIDEKSNERSHFKVVSFTAKGSEQILEVHTQAHKGWGFGGVSIVYPHVEFFDSNGKELTSDVKNLYFGEASTFMDGQYLRAVYKLDNLKPNSQYRVLVGANTRLTGKSMGTVTNYAAAGAGVFMQNGVQVSPVGPFWVLQTDSFKK